MYRLGTSVHSREVREFMDRRLPGSWWPAVVAAIFVVVLAQQPAGQQRPRPAQPPPPRLDRPTEIPLNLFQVPDGMEVTLWASSPQLHNPTNIDIDKDGRIWVA